MEEQKLDQEIQEQVGQYIELKNKLKEMGIDPDSIDMELK